MSAYKFPTLIWEDYEGWFTASLIDDEDFTSGSAQTAAEAKWVAASEALEKAG